MNRSTASHRRSRVYQAIITAAALWLMAAGLLYWVLPGTAVGGWQQGEAYFLNHRGQSVPVSAALWRISQTLSYGVPVAGLGLFFSALMLVSEANQRQIWEARGSLRIVPSGCTARYAGETCELRVARQPNVWGTLPMLLGALLLLLGLATTAACLLSGGSIGGLAVSGLILLQGA